MTNSNRLCVMVCLLEAIVLVVVAQPSNNSILVEEPAELLLPLNSTSDAVFTCTVIDGGTIEWHIDTREQTGLVFESNVDRPFLNSNGIFKVDTGLMNMSQVRVRRILNNNNTRLTCFGINGTVVQGSATGELLLFGPPSPPSDITVSISSALTLLLSWSPPYNPFIEVPFTYTLIIDSTTVLTGIPSNTTTYLYSTTDDGGSLCTNITFTLQSVNEAGSGDLSDTVSKPLPRVPNVPVNITTATEYNQTEDISLLLLSFKSPSVCPQYPISSYKINLTDITDSDNITTTTSTIVCNDGSGRGLMELTLDDGTIEPDRIYRGNVAAVNDVGVSDNSREIEFRTTDVVSLSGSIVSGDGSLDISCTFIRGTVARGCHVIVKTTPTNNTILNEVIALNHSNKIARKRFNINDMLPADSAHQLTITGYDYEYDGSMGSIPVEGTIQIQPTTRPTNPATDPPQTSSESITMVTRVALPSSVVTMTTSQDPTPTTVVVGSSAFISSTSLYITVSIVGGLIVLALVIVVMLIVLQRYYRIRRKRHSSGEGVIATDKGDTDFYQVIDTNHYQKPSNNSVFKSSDSLSPAPSTNSVNKLRTTPTSSSPIINIVGSHGNGDVVVTIDPVQPYGITTLRLSTPVKQPLESMYQTVPEANHKIPVTQQNSTAPLLPSTSFSSDSTESPPPIPPIHQLPQSSSAQNTSISPEPFYHTLEQNAHANRHRESNSTVTPATTPIPTTPSPAPPIPPPPTESLYDQVTERPSTATSYSSSTRAVPSPLQGTISATNTPTPKKDHIYHTLEENGPRSMALLTSDQDDPDFFTTSQSTCNSQQSGILDSQCTLSTVCSVRDNGNDVFDEIDSIGGLPCRQYPPPHYNVPRPSYQRQCTVEQARSKSRSLPMGARMGLRERSNSVPDNHVIGIEPYNTLERKIHGSTHTLKRTLV